MNRVIVTLFVLFAHMAFSDVCSGPQKVWISGRHGVRFPDDALRVFLVAINSTQYSDPEYRYSQIWGESITHLFEYGQELNARYVQTGFLDRQGFLTEARFYATTSDRAIQSTNTVASGLYDVVSEEAQRHDGDKDEFAIPLNSTHGLDIIISRTLSPGSEDSDLLSYGCESTDLFRLIIDGASLSSFDRPGVREAYDMLLSKLDNPILNNAVPSIRILPTFFGIPENDDRAAFLYVEIFINTIRSDLLLGNIPMGVEGLFTPSEIEQLQLLDDETFYAIYSDHFTSSVAVAPTVRALVDFLEGGDRFEDVKLILITSHDSNNQPLATILGFINDTYRVRYPEGEYMEFELRTCDGVQKVFTKFMGVDTLPTGCDEYPCTLEEFKSVLNTALTLDWETECSVEPRCQYDVSINQWNNGGIIEVAITPGVDSFGWTASIDVVSGTFNFVSGWNAVGFTFSDSTISFSNPTSYNFNAMAGVPLQTVGIQYSFPPSSPPVFDNIRFNGLLCDEV